MANKKVVARRELVREQVLKVKTEIEKGSVELAKYVHEIYSNAYYIDWGYATFEKYCHEELGIKYRKARYLVMIVNTVRDLKLDWDKVTGVGWSKIRVIAPVMTTENKDEWMDAAGDRSVRDLVEDVKGARVDVEAAPPKTVTLKFYLSEDAGAIILDAIDRAKQITETDSQSVALEHIAYEWIQQSGEGPQKVDLQTALGWIERSYGVKLVPEDVQDVTEMLAEG